MDEILVPDTNVWGDYWVGSAAFKQASKRKKSKDYVRDPSNIVERIDCAIKGGSIVIPGVISREIYGVIKYRFSRDRRLNLGKNKKKILESAIKEAGKMHARFGPASVDYTSSSYKIASGAYERIRADNSDAVLKKKDRWARTKYKKPWAELGPLKRTQPPYDDEHSPQHRDLKILASAIEAAGSERAVLATHDGDFTIFADEIRSHTPVDVLDPGRQ